MQQDKNESNGFKSMFSAKKIVVISEPDIQAALDHLRSLPHRPNLPMVWDRQHLLGLIREALPTKRNVGDYFQVGPGLYGIIKPFGVDLTGTVTDGRLQVWIVIRSAGTNPNLVTEL